MKTHKRFTLASVVGTTGLALGCAQEAGEADETPSADLNAMEAQKLITNVNGDGTWTADALTPVKITGTNNLYAKATFTGPSGKTRKMGVCAVKKGLTASGWKVCSTVADCNNAPTVLPTGGYRYCTQENGAGSKYCYFRPGPETSFCAGTPVNGYNPIAPGTYSTPTQSGTSPGSVWMSYACFEMCAVSDPSSSSTTTTIGHGG